MAVDYTKYLEAPIEQFEAPQCPAPGHYFATISGWTIGEKKFNDRKAVQVSIVFKLTSADTDVADPLDQKELARARVTREYDMDGERPAQHIIRKIAEETLELPVKGLSIKEVLDTLKGQDVKLLLDQRMDDSGQAWPVVKKVLSPHAE